MKMPKHQKYLYGPVPSRRLGRSLGIDIVPFKVCSLDCVYCQLGKTTEKSIARSNFTSVPVLLAELKEALAEGVEADYITIGGSGEPTLNAQLGKITDGIKKITDIPVAILTNGTLFYRPDVRTDCTRADVVIPSLDAGDEQTFQKINRPHKDISIEKVISGLQALRNEFTGQIWLEVFFVEGLNTNAEQLAKIKAAIDLISPDKVQLNTAVRPAAEAGIKRLKAEKLQAIASQLGQNCEVIADFSQHHHGEYVENKAEDVLSMLKRRPCSLNDICSALGIHPNEALKYITKFHRRGLIDSEQQDGITFFRALP